MAGKLLNTNDREKILVALLAVVEESTTRRSLINAWRVGRECFSLDKSRLEILTDACTVQNSELGLTPIMKSLKGGKSNA